MRHKILAVEKGSVCEELGILPGDVLVSINEQPVRDILDYNYYDAMNELSLTVIDSFGEVTLYDIEKEDDEHLGLRFENDLLTMRSCSNKCIFCFVDQLPKNMRNTLYVRDDDWRMSVLFGNFVTLTNVSSREIDRIIEQRISPLYISVHATDPELRKYMLGNENAKPIMPILQKLADNGISFHTQVVLCPDVNDGHFLRQTFEDLFTLSPYCKSLAIVPVGLTYHRKKLTHLRPFSSAEAKYVVDEITKWQKTCLDFSGSRFIFPSDEFYVLADLPVPDYAEYEDFPQIENGIGLMAKLKQEIIECLDELPPWIPDRKVSIATGVSAEKFIRQMCDIVCEKFPNLIVNVYPITNFFFGETVTVTGLLTGRDIAVQLEGKDLGSELIISDVMIRDKGDKFLDDLSVSDLSNWINKKVVPIAQTGEAFARALIGFKE